MSPRPRGWPLSTVITGAVIMLVALTTAAVGFAGWRAAEHTVDMLWHDLAENISQRTTNQTLRILDDASPFVEISGDLVLDDELDPSDHGQMLRYMESALDAHPHFTWVSWGDATDGTYLSVYRWPDGEGGFEVRRTERLQEVDESGQPVTRFIDDRRTEDGWQPVTRHVGRQLYDPRRRPWYLGASASDQGVWTDPYIFMSRQQPGVSYSLAVDDTQRHGVWCVEFEMQPLSAYLADLDVGENGRVYILEEDQGLVIAHPDGEVVRRGEQLGFFEASAHPDPMLSRAWSAWRDLPEDARDQPFEVGSYLAMAEPFPTHTRIPWVVLTVVPAEDFLGAARIELRTAAALGALALCVALVLGILLSRRLGMSVESLRGELLNVARFELDADAVPASPFREINEMASATEKMKQGLEGFARYVPRELVRQLVAAGQEARVGAVRQEVTVLFSDIAGFTTIVESTEPDVVMHALGDYLDAMNEAITGEQGTVGQYLGDGILAFWNAPRPVDDHAVRAGRAALRMMAAVDRLVDEAEAADLPAMHTRIGLDTGTVMVGNIGATDRFSYGILGDTVNTTARLEGINKVYGSRILVGPTAAEQIGDQLVLRPLDEVLPKGKVQPTWIYELVATPQDLDPDLDAALGHYADGLAAYREGDFAGAIPHFQAAIAARGEDPPSETLIRRCEALADSPPDDWTGVHVMTTK